MKIQSNPIVMRPQARIGQVDQATSKGAPHQASPSLEGPASDLSARIHQIAQVNLASNETSQLDADKVLDLSRQTGSLILNRPGTASAAHSALSTEDVFKLLI